MPLFAVFLFLVLLVPTTALADQCAELRARISELDGQIARDNIANSRNFRIQARDNYARAYTAICAGGGGSYSGGTGGGNPYANAATALNLFSNVLGALDAMQKRQEAARLQAEQEALEAERWMEQQRILEQARLEAEQLERDRAAAIAKAADDRKRMSMANPWKPLGVEPDNPFHLAPSMKNPLQSGVSSKDGYVIAPRQREAPTNPFDPAAYQQAPAPKTQGFKTDEDIARLCAGSANPSMCSLFEQDARARSDAYKDWKKAKAAETNRELKAANEQLDKAIKDYVERTGRPSPDELLPETTNEVRRERLRERLRENLRRRLEEQ